MQGAIHTFQSHLWHLEIGVFSLYHVAKSTGICVLRTNNLWTWDISMDTSLRMAQCKRETYSCYLWWDCWLDWKQDNNISCNYDISGMLAYFQVLEIGGFTCPSAVDCIYPRIQHVSQPQHWNVFFSSVLFFVSPDVITSLPGELNAILKKYQDWDLLNQMRSQGNIKHQLLTIFRNASRVCLHAPF